MELTEDLKERLSPEVCKNAEFVVKQFTDAMKQWSGIAPYEDYLEFIWGDSYPIMRITKDGLYCFCDPIEEGQTLVSHRPIIKHGEQIPAEIIAKYENIPNPYKPV